MNWIEVCVHTTNEAIEPIANILHEQGAAGVAIEDPLEIKKERDSIFGEIYELNPADYPEEGVYVKAYLAETDELEHVLKQIRESVKHLSSLGIDVGNAEVTTSSIEEESWATAWKQYYKPITVSDRITIVPEWEEYKPEHERELIIRMDPGMAFGTGTHPTTMLSVRALDRLITPGDTAIDVGCGSGVLSIAAALLGAEEIFAYDIDDIAISSTNANAELNRLSGRIHAAKNNLLDGVSVQADLIVSNILAEIIVKFVEDAWHCLKPGGWFVTSGIIQEKQALVTEKLETCGFSIQSIQTQEDWVSITAQKPE